MVISVCFSFSLAAVTVYLKHIWYVKRKCDQMKLATSWWWYSHHVVDWSCPESNLWLNYFILLLVINFTLFTTALWYYGISVMAIRYSEVFKKKMFLAVYFRCTETSRNSIWFSTMVTINKKLFCDVQRWSFYLNISIVTNVEIHTLILDVCVSTSGVYNPAPGGPPSTEFRNNPN